MCNRNWCYTYGVERAVACVTVTELGARAANHVLVRRYNDGRPSRAEPGRAELQLHLRGGGGGGSGQPMCNTNPCYTYGGEGGRGVRGSA